MHQLIRPLLGMLCVSACGTLWYHAERNVALGGSWPCVMGQLEAAGFDVRQANPQAFWLVAERDTDRRRASTTLFVIRDRIQVAVTDVLAVDALSVEMHVTRRGPTEELHEASPELSEFADWLSSRCGAHP